MTTSEYISKRTPVADMSTAEQERHWACVEEQIRQHRKQGRIGNGIGSANGSKERVSRLRRGGMEHHVSPPEAGDGEPDRIVKVCHQNLHQCPLAYAERMALANRHLGDLIRIEGVDDYDQIVTSQPFLPDLSWKLSDEEMRVARLAAMGALGFDPDDIPGDPPGACGMYRKPGYTVLDAAWHNFAYVREGGEVVAIPFDLQISRSGEEAHFTVNVEFFGEEGYGSEE